MTDEFKNTLHNPHDKLFKTVFSDPKEASSFFRSYLPNDLVATIDWASLQLIDKEFVDEEFKSSESDLLYQVRQENTEQEMFLYLLFEHQSTPDQWLRFRLLKYLCRIWDNSFKEAPDQQQLKPILPIVFYQGKSEWKHSAEFMDLITHENLNREFLPKFAHFLVDQSNYGLEQFQGEVKARIAQLLLKTAFHGQIQQSLKQLAEWLVHVESTGGFDYIEFFLLYFLDIVKDELTPEEIMTTIVEKTQSQNLGEKSMSLAQRLRAEGEAEGLEKGELIGEIRFAEQMLKQPQSSKEDLLSKTTEELREILKKLKQDLSL